MNSRMQPPPPPQLQHAEAQANINQSRNGQPRQTAPLHRRSQDVSAMQNPRYAQWSFTLWNKRKSEKIPWAEVKPQSNHMSPHTLQIDIERLHREGPSVRQAMKQISSINAQNMISDFVEAQNQDLMNRNLGFYWTITAIESKYCHVTMGILTPKKVLRSIDVYLMAEPHGLVQTNAAVGRVKAGNPGQIHGHRGNEHMPSMDTFDQAMHPHAPNPGHIHAANMMNDPRHGQIMDRPIEAVSLPQRRDQVHGHDEQPSQSQRRESGHGRSHGQSQHQLQYQHPHQDQNQAHMQGSVRLPPQPPPDSHHQRMQESIQPPHPRMQDSMQPPPPPPPNPHHPRMQDPRMQDSMQLPPPPPPNLHHQRMQESMQLPHPRMQDSMQPPPLPPPNPHHPRMQDPRMQDSMQLPPPPPSNQNNLRMPEPMQPPPPLPNAGQQNREHEMGLPPPPPPQPNAGQHNREHGMGMPPPPPPPPPGAPMAQQHNVSHHLSDLHPEMSTLLPQPVPYPSMRHEPRRFSEVLDPHILKLQKEKHRPPPTESVEETESETCSDADEPISSSESFSTESIESRSYDFITPRSRKPTGKKDKRGHRTRSRSQSRGRVPKLQKEKTSPRRANSILDRSSMAPDSRVPRRERSPKSSASPIQPQHFHFHMATSTTRERDDDQRDSNSERLREREQYRNQTFEPERQKDLQDRVVKQRSHKRSPSSSPRLSYDKIEQASAPSMSRGSSTDTYSDAVFTDETTSTFSVADDSVFSEPQKASHTQFDVNDRKPLISRGWHRQADDMVYQDTSAHVVRDVDPRAVRHHPVDGLANNHLQSSRHHRSRPIIHSPNVIHDRWHDDHDYIASRPPRAHRPSVAAHRNSVQVPFPSEHDRYAPTRSVSYVSEPTQNYYSTPKTLPYPRDQPDVFVPNPSFEPFQEREMDAYTHIQHSQRKPLHRSNTTGGRVPSRSVDPWANRDYPPSDGYVERGYERPAGYRVGSHPVRMTDARVPYLQQW